MDESVLQKTNLAKMMGRYIKRGSPEVRALACKVLDNAAARTDQKRAAAISGTKPGSPDKPAAPAGTESAEVVAPKVTNLFGTLNSASKKLGTSNAERAAAAAARTRAMGGKNRRTVPSVAPAPFSLGDIMAGLSKQEEPRAVKPAEDAPTETEEERQKRLRKEARRHLRVSWKPDSDLTEVRLFTHDPEEELGLDDRSRDVGDVKGEGSALKLHRDLDLEEDDDAGLREVEMLDYFEPSGTYSGLTLICCVIRASLLTATGIDNVEIGPEDQARNFVKRGGTQQPTSPESKAQEHREANTLMEFYASPADVPPSPKEPPPPSDDEPAMEIVSFGEVPDYVKVFILYISLWPAFSLPSASNMVAQARSERYYLIVCPKPAPPAQPSAPSAPSAPVDIPSLLRMLGGQQQQSTPPPPPQPAQTAMSDLERTVSMLSQQSQQASQPQPAPVMPMPQFAPDMQAILAIMNAQQQAQPALPQVPPQQSQPSIPPNLAAIISQFTGQNQQNGVNTSQSQDLREDAGRKRMRETAFDDTDDERYHSKRSKSSLPSKQHPKVGLVPCRYWASGKCRKGSDCTYRHDPS